jgi:DNA-binding MarR family transcriptional regulator
MASISPALEFFIHLAKAKTVVARRFDNRLSFNGLGFSDFVILYHLSQAQGEKMRRVDLAEKIGLTASGVTRMLLPMEKIGLVKRETSERDARVAYVTLAPGGKRLLEEGMDSAEVLSQDLLPLLQMKKMKEFNEVLTQLGSLTIY